MDNVIVAYALAVLLLVGAIGYGAYHQVQIDNKQIEIWRNDSN